MLVILAIIKVVGVSGGAGGEGASSNYTPGTYGNLAVVMQPPPGSFAVINYLGYVSSTVERAVLNNRAATTLTAYKCLTRRWACTPLRLRSWAVRCSCRRLARLSLGVFGYDADDRRRIDAVE